MIGGEELDEEEREGLVDALAECEELMLTIGESGMRGSGQGAPLAS